MDAGDSSTEDAGATGGDASDSGGLAADGDSSVDAQADTGSVADSGSAPETGGPVLEDAEADASDAGTAVPEAATPPALVSIAVTPYQVTVQYGPGPESTAQYVATGTYTDSTTQILTTSVIWASETTAPTGADSGAVTVATISNTAGSQGLATAMATGTASITATLGAITSSGVPATLTVVQCLYSGPGVDTTDVSNCTSCGLIHNPIGSPTPINPCCMGPQSTTPNTCGCESGSGTTALCEPYNGGGI
jgi:hypothetical protein